MLHPSFDRLPGYLQDMKTYIHTYAPLMPLMHLTARVKILEHICCNSVVLFVLHTAWKPGPLISCIVKRRENDWLVYAGSRWAMLQFILRLVYLTSMSHPHLPHSWLTAQLEQVQWWRRGLMQWGCDSGWYADFKRERSSSGRKCKMITWHLWHVLNR